MLRGSNLYKYCFYLILEMFVRLRALSRPFLTSGLGLGLGFQIGRRAQADTEPVPEAGRASLIDLNLEREAEEIISDAKCPSCLREALTGPCGGAFLLLFRCQDKVSDAEIENGACDTQWRNFSECYR